MTRARWEQSYGGCEEEFEGTSERFSKDKRMFLQQACIWTPSGWVLISPVCAVLSVWPVLLGGSLPTEFRQFLFSNDITCCFFHAAFPV